MGVFDNSKVKKIISTLLATVSIGGTAGCKKDAPNKEDSDILNERIESKVDDKKSDKIVLKDETEVEIKDEIEEIEDKKEESIKEEEKKAENTSKKEDDFKKAITGRTQRDRLEEVLENKDWGQEEEEMLLYLYDRMQICYDFREYNDLTKKQEYMVNFVDTIEYEINEIRIDPDYYILDAMNANAWADYTTKTITLRYGGKEISDLRHEVAHLEKGTFLNGSIGVDLGFVCEEGRASYISGDAMPYNEYVDGLYMYIDNGKCDPLIVQDFSGSYGAFEEIYKTFLELGIDMESLRKEENEVGVNINKIENQLNEKLGSDLGTKYMESVNGYIEFFNNQGLVDVEEIDGRTAINARDDMLATHKMCMEQMRNNEKNIENVIER